MRGGLLLLSMAITAFADDAKPLPLAKTVILPSGGNYFVEGRQEIVWGQELSVQKNTRIVGRGENATLVVSGALQVRGVEGSSVEIEGLVIEAAEKCERIHLEAVKYMAGAIRTPEGKACGARVHLEEVRLDDTPVELRLTKGEVTILNSRTKGLVKLVGVPGEGKTRPVVQALVNCCNVDRDLVVEGLSEIVVRGNAISGNVVGFKDCAVLTFDGNVVRSPSVVFEQTVAGGFKKTQVQKSDFHGGALILKAPRVDPPVDKIPVDKCWFQGRTKEKEILGRDIKDGHTDQTSGAFVVFRKINERELKLGGMTTGGGQGVR